MNTNLEWPGLDYWCDLPDGVTIPAGTRYAFWSNDGEITIRTTPVDWRPVVGYGHYRTETPIVRPLPTEPGAIIRVGLGQVLTLVPDSYGSPEWYSISGSEVWNPTEVTSMGPWVLVRPGLTDDELQRDWGSPA